MLFGPKLIGDIWNANNIPRIRGMLINFIQNFDFTLEEYNILVTMAGLSLLVKLFSSSNTMIKAKTNQVLQQVTLDRATSEVILNYCGSNYYIGLLYNKTTEGLKIPVSLLIEREWDPTEIVEIDRYLLSQDILNITSLDLSCIIYILLLFIVFSYCFFLFCFVIVFVLIFLLFFLFFCCFSLFLFIVILYRSKSE